MDVQVVNLLPHHCIRWNELQERSQTMFTLLSQDVSLLTKETTQIFLLSSKKKIIFDIIIQSKKCKIIHVNINLICEGKSVALYVQNDTVTNSTCFSVRMMAFWLGYMTCAQSGPTAAIRISERETLMLLCLLNTKILEKDYISWYFYFQNKDLRTDPPFTLEKALNIRLKFFNYSVMLL